MGLYPAYYLMGREPLPLRIPPLTSERCRSVVLCGISTCFQVLSPSKGQVAHALLTRSPLGYQPKSISPFDLHVLGTPPAFVLSQDQTLEFNLYRLSPAVAHFPSLGRLFVFAFLRSPSGERLACSLMHCIVFKVLLAAASRSPARRQLL